MDEKIKFVFILALGKKHLDLAHKCLVSIRLQTYKNWFILLYNDTEFPSQKEIINDPKIKWFNDGKNKGQVHRLNQGLHYLLSKEKNPDEIIYVNFHGMDDHLYDIKVLENVAQCIWGFNTQWLYGNSNQIEEREKEYLVSACSPGLYEKKMLKKKNYIPGGSVFVNLELYRQAGDFRDLMFGQGADWDMWLRLGDIVTPRYINYMIYTERLGTSMIRPKPKTLKTKIFNRIKYPIWRIERELRPIQQPYKQSQGTSWNSDISSSECTDN